MNLLTSTIMCVRIAHDWLVETKSLKIVTIEVFSFVPPKLHIWHPYVWFWRLFALWMVPGDVQWRSRQIPAIVRVCTLIIPLH